MTEFRYLLRQVMDEKGLKAIDVTRMTGIGSGAISQYLSGKRTPKVGMISKIAEGLNVSEPFLLGYDVPMERKPAEVRRKESETLEEEMTRRMWKEISDIFEKAGFAERVHIYSLVKKAEDEKKKRIEKQIEKLIENE